MKKQNTFLPAGIAESIQERSRINAAIYNLNASTKYLKMWLNLSKGNRTEENLACLDYQIQHSQNDFYSVEFLAEKYSELYGKKFLKAKLAYEKAVAEAKLLLNQ